MLKKYTGKIVHFGALDYARTCFFLFVLFSINCIFFQAQGQTQTPTPHPAVVRIIARHVREQEISLGSGTLIAKKTNYGFIITNWHVIRDSNGSVTVKFPDSKTYESAVVAVDDRWDLALLVISEPKGVEPVVISPTIPRIGDTCWVAGYGSDGKYRIHGGRCIKFQAPEMYHVEPEFIEISVPSENGDSGGPIFNAKSELAGVLFGSTETTMGSHCGRVFKFLELAAPNVARLPASPEPIIKAASLSQQTILQRGAVAFGSLSKQEARPVAVQHSTNSSSVSSSSSFAGVGIRARGNNDAVLSQTLTPRKRHGFLNLEYDLSVANDLLAAERRNGTNSQSNTPVSGIFSLADSSGKNSPAGMPSDPTVRPVQPIQRTGTQSGTLGSHATSVAMTDPTITRNTTALAASIPATTASITTTPTTSAQTAMMSDFGYVASNSTSYSSRSGNGFGGTESAMTGETVPDTPSQTTLLQTAGTLPAYGGNTNNGNTNLGGSFNDRPGRGTATRPATGTFDVPMQRDTETALGGTRNGTGKTTNNSSNGASSGGRTTPTSSGFNSYSQNPVTSQPSVSSPTHGGSSWQNNDLASTEYALHASDMQMDEDYAPKYTDDYGADSPGADVTGATSKYDAIKIVVAILVIFFILFHTIKTMAVAEERQQLA